MVLFRKIDYCIDMKPMKVIVAIVSLCLTIATGRVFATTPLLHVRQNVSWSRSLTSKSDLATSLSIGYSDHNLFLLGGVRQQAQSTDIGLMTKLKLTSWKENPDFHIEAASIESDTNHIRRKVAFPAILTMQGHYSIQQGVGSNLDLTFSIGQDLRTRSPRNWWGFSYTLGLQTSFSFSPYLEKPLLNFAPAILLSMSKVFGGRVFLELFCNTNTQFNYTSRVAFVLGGVVAVRISEDFLLGVSGKVRFADLPTETAFLTLGEATVFLNWQEALP